MRKQHFIAYILFLLLQANLLAQAEKNHRISFGIGYGQFEVRDLFVSPLIYSGSFLPLDLSYQYNSTNYIHKVEFSYCSGTQHSSVGNLMDGVDISLLYGFLYRFTELNNNMNLFGGINWNNNVSVNEYYIGSSYISGYLFSSMELSIIGKYKMETSEVKLNFEIPFLSFMFRRYYLYGITSESQVFERGKFMTIDEFYGFRTTLQFEKEISSYVNIGLKYKLIFHKLSKPYGTATVKNIFGVYLTILI